MARKTMIVSYADAYYFYCLPGADLEFSSTSAKYLTQNM